MIHFDPKENQSGIPANLDLLKEVREDVNLRTAARRRKIAQYFNKRVKVRRFEKGKLVLRKYRASMAINEPNIDSVLLVYY